jgi:hypothetical protein
LTKQATFLSTITQQEVYIMAFTQAGSPKKSRMKKQEVAVPSGPVPVNTGPILGPDDDFLYEELVLIGGVACDWLTLTTFDEKEWIAMCAYTVSSDATRNLPVRTAKRMQYHGWSGDGWFVGEGRQDGLPHYMMQAHGARAHDALRHALMFHENRGLVKCTRIDLQCTSSSGFAGDLPAIAESIRGLPSGAFGGRGPRPTITYFSSEKSEDTMYIGSRKSPRFWRFYNKPISGELRLRAELEAKGWLAGAIWDELCETGLFHVKQVHGRELGALPDDVRAMARDCYVTHDDANRTPKPHVDRDALIATQRWMLGVVIPALERILETDIGMEVRQHFLMALGIDRRPED